MKYYIFAIIFLFIAIIYSCNSCNDKNAHISKMKISKEDSVTVKIHRYEKALFAVDIKNLKNGLKKLLPEYSFFIPDSSLNDPSNILQIKNYLTDPFVIALYEDCIKIFPDLKNLESQLGNAFGYYKHYFPEKKVPEVYSCVSGLYYQEPVKFVDNVFIIALDMYLGSNNKYYKEMLGSVPLYIQKRFRKDYILPDCMKELAKTLVDNSKENKKFIDYIIYEGKILYFLDAVLPDTPDSLKIYYTPAQMDWCQKNESNIWSFIIDKKLLYSTDPSMITKFCTDGPFTAVFSRQSPSRVGIWIGWQIVRAYMENNKKISIKELFTDQDAQGILTRSKYKPKK